MTSAHNLDTRPGTPSGYRIGKYRIRARLGKGGMGIVYLGRDEALDRDVAIKTLRVEGLPDEESRRRFEIEARAAARLQHPNIVTVYELGEDRGLPFIAMELLDGQDLETLLRSGERLSPAERLDIVIQTLRGLDFAHSHHIIHRDMKPSNIRVLDDGGVKILDFGIAKVESTSMTRAGMMVGTPYYMSPEHIRGSVLDGRSDVFAIGVILHELFALKRPFTAEDPTRVMSRIVNDPHPRLNAGAAGPFTAEVQQIIDRALEKDADARFTSASEMADEVSRVREFNPPPHLGAEDTAILARARKVNARTADPKAIESVERIAKAHPDAAEAQRLVRLFKRKPAEPSATAETATFPELDATFGRAERGSTQTLWSGNTVSGRAETAAREAPLLGPAPRSRVSNSLLYTGMAAAMLTAVIASLVYVSRARITDGGPDGPVVSSPTAAGAAVAPMPTVAPLAAAATRAAATREETTGGQAPARRPEPAPSKPAATKAEPATNLAAVTRPQLTPPPPAAEAKRRTETAVVRLERSVALATLVVESAYPVTVSASGRVLATDQTAATLTLNAGTQDILIESAALSLRQRETVQLVAGASVTVRTPSAGKIGVRASPDNCKVLIDGAFVDYPPILDRAIVAGSHLVTFEWPDGARAEQRIQVLAGKPAYVMGRKP